MRKIIQTLALAALCLNFAGKAQEPGKSNALQNSITGKVISASTKEALPGAVIKIINTNQTLITNDNGEFTLNLSNGSYNLSVHYLSHKAKSVTIQIPLKEPLIIALDTDEQNLQEVEIVSTGYQQLPKERATGSFVQIDNELLNRSVGTNILDRLKGVTSAVAFNDNNNSLYQQSKIEVRGRSTLFSPAAPLIIVDNFPYEGDFGNINPNDIESITILKDAAAASIWGSKSGNGVIVITTKKGGLNMQPTVSLNSNVNIGAKPDLYYIPQLSSAEYIEVEDFLFDRGVYNSLINNGYSALSPAVEIFSAKRKGLISEADSLSMINHLKSLDSREQLLKYTYRKAVHQQHQVNIAGGSASQKYFVSGGYDHNLASRYNHSYDRITLNGSNTYYFLKNKLEFFTNIIYTGSSNKTGPSAAGTPYPYDQLADEEGKPLVIPIGLRPAYAATAGNGKLLNWLYKPLEEQEKGYGSSDNRLTDYRINLSLNYNILKALKASLYYSYGKGVSENNTLYEQESFYTRDLINRFTQINATSGAVTYPLPLGAILNTVQSYVRSHNGRIQLNYNTVWKKHGLNVLAGTEIRDNTGLTSFGTLYGYDEETATNQNQAVNYTVNFPLFYNPSSAAALSSNSSRSGTTNRFLSYYFNGSYIFNEKYIASVSLRRDESNLFGVATNQKGVPLWSAGLSWLVNKEHFYDLDWLSSLKVKATYGYTGNVNNSISAYLTARSSGTGLYNAYSAQIVNPPNPSLRWEKVKNVNLGLDFIIKKALYGSIDFWRKEGIDLIGNSPIAAQNGISLFTGNSANTRTRGIDLQLSSTNLNGHFKWSTILLYNYSQSKVTDYKVSNGTNYNVVSSNSNNPLQGYPFYSIFSFRYEGLNNTGSPQGYLNGTVSTDYNAIRSSVNRDELVYHGSAVPTSFGSLRNVFGYKGIDLSFNITFKFDYYFRRGSLENGTLYSIGSTYQIADYAKRWQKPGDELSTHVPALIYPSNSARNNLYTYSEVLVEKADHIRFQDIRLGYTLTRKAGLPINDLMLFAYTSNLGMIWKANKKGIDPDYPNTLGAPAPRSIAFGLTAKF